VTRHGAEIDQIDPVITGVSPELAVAVVRNGGRFDLAGDNGSDWELQAWALTHVAQVGKDVALSAIDAEPSTVLDHLAKLDTNDIRRTQKASPIRLILVVASDASVTIHERHDFWESPTSHLT
jgi:hypothetical protein